jgi:hypothetical protein
MRCVELARSSLLIAKRWGTATWFLAIIASVEACIVHEVAPPPVPERTMPAVPNASGEVRAGMARVAIATDVPARVRLRDADGRELPRDTVQGAAPWGRLCTETPCAVTLPRGRYQLNFWAVYDGGRSSSASVTFAHDSEVVNHALGQERVGAGQPIGAGLIVVGTALLAWAALSVVVKGGNDNHDVAPEKGMAVGALGGIVVGGVLLGVSATTRQPGSTTQWSPQTAR